MNHAIGAQWLQVLAKCCKALGPKAEPLEGPLKPRYKQGPQPRC